MAREPAGPLEYSRKFWLRAWLVATFVLLYAPIVILIAFSFNDSRRNIVWQGFTLEYYDRAWQNASLIEAFTNSIVIALLATAPANSCRGLSGVPAGLTRQRQKAGPRFASPPTQSRG